MTEIELKFKSEANVVARAIEWCKNENEFLKKIRNLDEAAWTAYKYILILQIQNEDYKEIFKHKFIFEIIEQKGHNIIHRANLLNEILDVFEVMQKIESKSVKNKQYHLEMANFYAARVKRALDDADNDEKIELYLNIGQRLDPKALALVPVNVYCNIINQLHPKGASNRAFANCLLLLDRACNVLQSDQLIQAIWKIIKKCVKCETACDTCCATLAHLVAHFTKQTAADILNDELFWKFIQSGLLCGQVHQSKRIVHILKAFIKTIERDNLTLNTPYMNNAMLTIWDPYFSIIESLYEIQSHIILATLNSYLKEITQKTTIFWQKIILILALQHSNILVNRYAAIYITQNGISIFEDDRLALAFLYTLNTPMLFENWKSNPNDLSTLFENDLNKSLTLLMNTDWKPVPLWFVLYAISNCVIKIPNDVNVPTLLRFLMVPLKVFNKKESFMLHAFNKVCSMIQAIGLNNVPYPELLQFYELTGNQQLFANLPPIASSEFQNHILGCNSVSHVTKLDFLDASIPDLNERIDFLDQIIVNEDDDLDKQIDYEIFLFRNLVLEKTLSEAIELCKRRIYNIIKPKPLMTITSLCAGVQIVEFITTHFRDAIKFTERNHLLALYENMNAAYKSVYTRKNDECNRINTALKSINATLYFAASSPQDSLTLTQNVCEALELNEYEMNLSVLKNENIIDAKCAKIILHYYLNTCSHTQMRAKNLISFLTEFPNLHYPIYEVFNILTKTKQPIVALLNVAAQNQTDDYIHLLVQALLYGKELKGDLRVEYEIGARIDPSVPTYNQCIRLSAFRHIKERKCLQIIRKLKTALFDRNVATHRTRYFNHSIQHSIKTRYMQAWALLFKLDPVWDERLLHGILNENNQPNVTFINELIVAETVNPDYFIKLMNEIEGHKGLHSFFIISFYLCIKHKSNKEFHRYVIKNLMPRCFTKNLNVRLTAQSVFMHLIEKCDLTEEYNIIYSTIKDGLESIETLPLNRIKKWYPAQDVRLNYIDCTQLLNEIYYLYEIPRITDMSPDEIYAMGLDGYDERLRINLSTPINYCMWSDRFETEVILVDPEPVEKHNAQKKIVPLKENFIDFELINNLPIEMQRSLEKYKIQSDIIVVASLVGKLPNLGGISRTCEVLGVKQYVISNLSDKDQSEFQALSMASEKWLNLLQMPPQYLVEYIVHMKAKGYVIVGAEQTTYSKQLHQTMLPKKTILILGHEKDGIPPNIINLLDIAVEIPQFGVVRSLNVHVSAALFLWEYCKQHIINT